MIESEETKRRLEQMRLEHIRQTIIGVIALSGGALVVINILFWSIFAMHLAIKAW